MFDEVKLSACEFWDLSHKSEEFILTDEYFNNLASYKDTIQNFFAEKSGYQPLNPQCDACVFLIKKNAYREKLHFLQIESVEISKQI